MNIQRNLFYLNEKLWRLIQSGGTLDYEEYFNRRMLGFEKSMSSEWWTFTKKSNYGNGENTARPSLYFCGKDSQMPGQEDVCLGPTSVSIAPNKTNFSSTVTGKNMAYGQYLELGFNYASRTGFPTPMKLPPIFPMNNTVLNNEGMSDLYLIKKLPNNTYERTYFRHVYVQDPSFPVTTKPCNPSINLQWCLGKIQMTKLVSCDIFNSENTPNTPDGKIDVWAKHPDFWGSSRPCTDIAGVNSISTATNNLRWADVSSPDMNIIRAQFLPRPLKIPSQMSGVGEAALSPMIQIHLEVQLSQRVLSRGLLAENENAPRFLTTTFDLENN
jgi:hypothetical protein